MKLCFGFLSLVLASSAFANPSTQSRLLAHCQMAFVQQCGSAIKVVTNRENAGGFSGDMRNYKFWVRLQNGQKAFCMATEFTFHVEPTDVDGVSALNCNYSN